MINKFRIWSSDFQECVVVTLEELFTNKCSFFENKTVNTFTGFKDRKKNEWFDGDILQPKNFSKRKWKQGQDERALIYWDNACAKFSLNFYSIYGGEGSSGDLKGQQLRDLLKEGWIKVGNIHENPELIHGTLKEKKNLKK